MHVLLSQYILRCGPYSHVPYRSSSSLNCVRRGPASIHGDVMMPSHAFDRLGCRRHVGVSNTDPYTIFLELFPLPHRCRYKACQNEGRNKKNENSLLMHVGDGYKKWRLSIYIYTTWTQHARFLGLFFVKELRSRFKGFWLQEIIRYINGSCAFDRSSITGYSMPTGLDPTALNFVTMKCGPRRHEQKNRQS
ncbi:hypothetical protein K461DRAFT_37071 [Myriangium duriaei CBS 260.36]|uniref:Uncharacterized protein n=1 Tax=Myriangium duriaei CBS 260.36 TaxID=1168546 RepID=A0A9P4ME93_9PEZI|nr:hypothetical protein K461DRAFT_37071 [Myriangium duriaei CBS 260.36]